MKILLAAVLATAASLASANEIVEHDYARVVSVTPLTRTSYHVIPRTTCNLVEKSSSAPVTGAILGGVVGSNMARNRDHGAVVGAITGAIVGEHLAEGKPVERCTTYHDREYYNTVTGYNVTIEYQGQLRTVRLDRAPLDRVPVRVVKRIFVIE